MIEELRRTAWFATLAHWSIGQKRKYTDEPYIVHPMAVAQLVREVMPNDLVTIQAAILHDVVEDTGVSLATIRRHFGPYVATLVDGLTDLQTPEDGNRATRKQRERERLGRCCDRVKTIKVADYLDNSVSIIAHDYRFAGVYMKEVEATLPYLEGAHEKLLSELALKISLHKSHRSRKTQTPSKELESCL